MALRWLSKLIGAVVVLFCLQASVAPLRAESAVKKIGVDHVGIASDFNHGGGVIGWDSKNHLPAGFVAQLPKTETGKLKRFTLRQMA